jgi:hypothetical protein
MYGSGEHFAQRIIGLRRRARGLRKLRELVAVAPSHDLRATQWAVIEGELGKAAHRFEASLDELARARLIDVNERESRVQLASALGRLELELSSTYALFDTFMDVLTQRSSARLGPLLKGCDVLALDALRRDRHPALAVAAPPLVYLNRGFGAAILRSGVAIPAGGRAPVPLVQLPYARLQEKYHLSSLVHEVGHEALVRIGLRDRLVHAVRKRLDGLVDPAIRDACARWITELAPDFWAFGCCGTAHAMTVRDVLALPLAQSFEVREGAVHPPVYFRTLAAFDWCRRAFGRGEWDDWERAYRDLHPLGAARADDRAFLEEAIRIALPRISDLLFSERFAVLERRALADLFDLGDLHPVRLSRDLHHTSTRGAAFAAERPTTQLSVFRWMREVSRVSETALDDAMTDWLCSLARSSSSSLSNPSRNSWPALSTL